MIMTTSFRLTSQERAGFAAAIAAANPPLPAAAPEDYTELALSAAQPGEPDRDLDMRIWHVHVLGYGRPLCADERDIAATETRRGRGFLDHVPRYTGRLDDALTLYPRLPERIPSSARAAAAEALEMLSRGGRCS